MRLFNNPKPAVFLIVLFLLLFFAYQAWAAEVEVGPTYTGGFNGGVGLTFSERFSAIDVGVSLISDQQWDGVSVSNNGNVWAAYVARRPATWWPILPSELSLGPSVWIKTQDPIAGCVLGYMLSLKYRIGQGSIGVRHWSNAGTCKPNRGQDLLTFGWAF